MRTVFYHILKDSSIRDKLRAELDDPEAEVSHPVPFQHAFNDLPYLGAVIQEALRYHPPFALLLERAVPASGLTLPSGVVLPPGSNVGVFGYTVKLQAPVVAVALANSRADAPR